MSLSKAKKSKSRKLEEELPQDEPSGSFLFMEAERVLNTYDTNSDKPMLEEHWAVEEYAKKIEIEMINESEDGMTLEFDLVHTEAPIANAIRRILIAEVPTMAIERVYLYQNTSVIQDEVLCHRLGLLPIKADPRLFDWPLKKVVGVNEEGTDCDEEPTGDPKRELIFRLNIKCTRNQGIGKLVTNPKLLYENSFVYTNSFEWVPIENQSDTIRPPPAMVHDDILIAKLRPGQEIEASCHCVKGIGRDHAKFSPVATASYRLLPVITLKRQFCGKQAEIVKDSFSKGVIGIGKDGVAFVKDARSDACSRNILRHEELAKDIELSRRKDHFIFSVESTGALKSSELVTEACKVMEEKCHRLKEALLSKLGDLRCQIRG